MNILLVDSGATKATWVLLQDGQRLYEERTPGISPYFLANEEISSITLEIRQKMPVTVDALYFYSTGCKAIEQQARMAALFQELFPEADTIEVGTDMLAAARSTCQGEPGLVGILGTGSNACYYNGEHIEQTAGGLGFILGDEGSGAAIGKALLIAYLNRELPAPLHEALEAEYQLSRDHILQAVYQLPYPSRFLATFAPFVRQYRHAPFLQELLEDQFSLFLRRSLIPLGHTYRLPLHCTGSVAFYFQADFQAAAKKLGLQVRSFQQDPMPGLIRFHQQAAPESSSTIP